MEEGRSKGEKVPAGGGGENYTKKLQILLDIFPGRLDD
jgi:hypothetical protein